MEFLPFIEDASKKTEKFVNDTFDINISKVFNTTKKETLKLLSDIDTAELENTFMELLKSIDFQKINDGIDKLSLDKKIEHTYSIFNLKLNSLINSINLLEKSSLDIFNRSKKGKLFLKYIEKYSPISIEKLDSIINEAAQSFDIRKSSIVSILVGEFNPVIKKSPFISNSKGIGQFLEKTFGDFINGHISGYFKQKGENVYANNLDGLNITNLNDRYDPYKGINAIAAYLKYIEVIVGAKNIPKEYIVAMYNVGPNGVIENHLKSNPAIAKIYNKIYPNLTPNTQRILHAASIYYGQYT